MEILLALIIWSGATVAAHRIPVEPRKCSDIVTADHAEHTAAGRRFLGTRAFQDGQDFGWMAPGETSVSVTAFVRPSVDLSEVDHIDRGTCLAEGDVAVKAISLRIPVGEEG